jgi:tRNA pseudouridine55 synthase
MTCSGILPVDKPAGWTSHDVVARVRRLAGQREVGHAGTLDPLATGVLLLVLGKATRLSSYLMESRKVYCAEVVLGVTTVTDDAEAPIERQRPLPPLVRDDIEGCLHTFIGMISQAPPRYAAVRHGGQKLYKLARQGVAVAPEPRQVAIHTIDLEDWSPPRLRLRITCGSGTYIRSLARDIGAALEVGGYLHALRRTVSGSFTLADCRGLDDLHGLEDVRRSLKPLDWALLGWPAAVLGSREVDLVLTGKPAHCSGATRGNVRLYDISGRLVALARVEGGVARPFRVFDGGR